jgi:hypothetical protein
MRQLLVFAILSIVGAACGAEVIRCADAAGNVSYTDKACPAGAREVGRVSIAEPATPTPEEVEQQRQAQLDSAERANQARQALAATRQPPAPAGPVIIDSRGTDGDRNTDSRGSDRGTDPGYVDDGYGYPYLGGYRRPPPPRDLRPRIRSCGAAGCRDTQGNQYNRAGQLDHYQTPDGRSCRPVGTTTICR